MSASRAAARRRETFPDFSTAKKNGAVSRAVFAFPFSHQRHIADAVERFKRLDLLVQRRFAVHPEGERAAHGAAALLLCLAEEVQVPNVVSVALYLADDLADRALFSISKYTVETRCVLRMRRSTRRSTCIARKMNA